MKKKYRLKKQLIFNCISMVILLVFSIYYGYRFIHHKLINDKPVVYSNILAERLVQMLDPYAAEQPLILTNGIYRYVGTVDNIYVKYMGYTWRIVRINEDKSVTMIMDEPVISLAYGDTKTFTDSQVYKWLNTIKDTQYTGIFDTSLDSSYLTNSATCLDRFDSTNEISCFEVEKNTKITLLGIKDYYEAGGASSYLNTSEYFWASNTTREGKFWYVSDEGKVGTSDHSEKYGIRPVITLKPKTEILDGNGTSDHPYIITKGEAKVTKDAYIGDYISFNNELWRIISKNDKSIKIVSENCLKDVEDACIEKIYSSINNTFDITSKGNLLEYLNNEYYKSIEKKEYIVKGAFYTGSFSRMEDYNYTTIFASSSEAYVGLLTVVEPFAYEVPNIFLLTSNFDNEISIYIINENKFLFEDAINSKRYIRPSVYLMNNIEITDGNGSYLFPYILGGVISET